MAGNQRGRPRRRPATTIEGREGQLVSLAMDLAEEQLAAGTAPAQVVIHYLRLGSTRERLEQKRLEEENKLLKARVENLSALGRIEELYGEALRAMRTYQGQDDGAYDDED